MRRGYAKPTNQNKGCVPFLSLPSHLAQVHQARLVRDGDESALAGGGAPGMRTGDQAKEEELQHLRLGAEIIDCR